MNEINPYQPPALTNAADLVMADQTFAAKRCPHCHAPFTFHASLRQHTPFQFKCPNCRAECRVLTPRMPFVFFFTCFGATLILGGAIWCYFQIGVWAIVLIVPILLAWLALEVWTYRHILAHGRFQVTKIGDRPPAA